MESNRVEIREWKEYGRATYVVMLSRCALPLSTEIKNSTPQDFSCNHPDIVTMPWLTKITRNIHREHHLRLVLQSLLAIRLLVQSPSP